MKKIIAFVLSLVLIVGCIGFAENNKAQAFNVNVNGEKAVSLVAETATDDDGCKVIHLTGNYLQDAFDALLQISGTGITLGMNDQYYTLTGETCGKLLKSAFEGIAARIESFDMDAVIDQFAACIENARQTIEDIPAFAIAGISEAARLMKLAGDMGIVTTNEAGDTYFTANLQSMTAFAASYLRDLAEDTDVLEMLAGTNTWKQQNLPEAKEAAELLKTLADEIEKLDFNGEVFDVILCLRADGSVYTELSIVNEGVGSYGLIAEIDGNRLTARATVDGANYIIDCTFNETENGEEALVTVHSGSELLGTYTVGLEFTENGFTGYVKGDESAVIANFSLSEDGFRFTVDAQNTNSGENTSIVDAEFGPTASDTLYQHVTGTELSYEDAMALINGQAPAAETETVTTAE